MRKKTHTFFLKILSCDEAKMEFEESDTECLGKFQTKEKMNSHIKFEGKLKNIFKKLPSLCKTRVFRSLDKSPDSRQIHLPKHFKSKVLKNFLSIFRDWKPYSRGSRELSRENLCVPLATGPSTREQVAKTDPRLSCKNRATLFFEIFSF